MEEEKQLDENNDFISSLWGKLSKRAKILVYSLIGTPIVGGGVGGYALYQSGAEMLVRATKPAFEAAGFVVVPDSLSFPKAIEKNVYVMAIAEAKKASARLDTLEWMMQYQQGVNHYFLVSTCDTAKIGGIDVHRNCYGDMVIEYEFKGRNLLYVVDPYAGDLYIEPFQWQLDKGELNKVKIN